MEQTNLSNAHTPCRVSNAASRTTLGKAGVGYRFCWQYVSAVLWNLSIRCPRSYILNDCSVVFLNTPHGIQVIDDLVHVRNY